MTMIRPVSVYSRVVCAARPPNVRLLGCARSALLSLLHVYLNCATRDGLNLLPFEYVLTKSVLGQDGVVVLSEFVGCSHVLNGGVRVNPFNLEHVVEQLDAALSIPADERKAARSKRAVWRLQAALRIREKRRVVSGPAERPGLGARPHQSSPMSLCLALGASSRQGAAAQGLQVRAGAHDVVVAQPGRQ